VCSSPRLAHEELLRESASHQSVAHRRSLERADPRPDVRENASQLGNLTKDFNFSQRPRKPVLLPVHPKTDLIRR